MKKKRLKIKKSVWKFFILLLFVSIAIYVGISIYKDIQYKKTNEYKLLEVGYSKEDIKSIESNLEQKEIETLFNTDKNEFLLSLFKENYYIKSYLNRYLDYKNKNTTSSSKEVVAIVNTNADYDFYDFDKDTDISKDHLLIVNKYYNLKENYKPDDLVEINNKYYYGNNHKIRRVAYEAFKNMWNKAQEEDIYLIINSSFRDYNSQVDVYNDYKDSNGTTYADSIAARPGYSEHQTGLALDIFSKEHTFTSNFKDSPAHNWLKANAYKYGFIERYQEGKEDITGFAAESWHWRYVGVEVATYIFNNNITFDEYYAYFIEQ